MDEAAASMHSLLWAFMAGEPVPEDFAVALMILPPKGEVEGQGMGVGRRAAATSPLGLTNTDAKVVQAALSHSMSVCISRNAQHEQRGFVRGRKLAQNVLDMDTRMRMDGLRGCIHATRAAVFFDFTAALPSASHEFLFAAISAVESLKAP